MSEGDLQSTSVDWQVGQYLTLENKEGRFNVAMIIGIDDGKIVLKLFSRRFPERPVVVKRDDLSPYILNRTGEPEMTIALTPDLLSERKAEPLDLPTDMVNDERQGTIALKLACCSFVSLILAAVVVFTIPETNDLVKSAWVFVLIADALAVLAIAIRPTTPVIVLTGLVFLAQFGACCLWAGFMMSFLKGFESVR